MCGIAGSVNFQLNYPQVNASMGHRGPDAQNGYRSENIDLYHLRLSIVDIAGGQQPMHLNDRYTIIFNGEIYNHQSLRKQFQLQTTTASDTETLLLLYQKLGIDFLQYLDGMFVFALYDNQEKQIVIARDRAGKKPLYYFNDGEKFVFASELNALNASLPLEIDTSHFHQYLRLGAFYRQSTPYKNVQELGSGSYLTVNTQTLKVAIKEWWNIHPFYQQHNSDSFETSKEKVDQMLHEGIRRRVESSDLEVGSFLSGGIDSGLVTAIASQYNKNLKTFTVSFEGEYDEAPLAKLVAEKYGTIHTTIPIAFTALKNDIEKIISNYGEPFFDSSAIPSYYVSCEARKHLTVILNGDGADELFGGYRRYVPFAQYDFFGSGKFVRNMAAITKTMMPAAHNKKSKYNYIYRLASLASRNSAEIYLSAGVDIFEDFEKYFIHTQGDYMADLRKDFASITAAPMSGLKKLMNVDFTANLFSDLLVKMDIATMAHSLEGRSPFLCKELLEYVPSMNDQYKIKGRTTKFLLRELAKKYLPTELIHQPKRGFEIPLKNWVNHELKEMINDYVLDPYALNKQLVNPAFVAALVNQKVKIPAEKRAKILYTLFSMEVWYKKVYLSGKS